MYYAHKSAEMRVAALSGASNLDAVILPGEEIVQRTQKRKSTDCVAARLRLPRHTGG
eukprot:TRINITY_DN5710_c0_g1_i1.p2 TRINITY_DN5710_c0_g1~~TRINITY_DN5710_c0_g1_i1.p2  ORF type:complete len:57 (+),score=12.68 TRINITY_DN5710_c0_g1_i1:97-267(+)